MGFLFIFACEKELTSGLNRYRHQLEAFVDKVRGREPKVWVSAEDSIETIHWVEEIYAKVRRCCLEDLS